MGAFSIVRHDDKTAIAAGGVDRKETQSNGAALVGGPIPLPTPPSSLGSARSMLASGSMDSNNVVASAADVQVVSQTSLVQGYVEIWSYTSGLRFRGFVGSKPGDPTSRALFVFFEADVLDKDLKKAYVRSLHPPRFTPDERHD